MLGLAFFKTRWTKFNRNVPTPFARMGLLRSMRDGGTGAVLLSAVLVKSVALVLSLGRLPHEPRHNQTQE
jgi:hypothetical protein